MGILTGAIIVYLTYYIYNRIRSYIDKIKAKKLKPITYDTVIDDGRGNVAANDKFD